MAQGPDVLYAEGDGEYLLGLSGEVTEDFAKRG